MFKGGINGATIRSSVANTRSNFGTWRRQESRNMDYIFSVFLNYYHTIFHRYGVEIRGPNLFDFSHLLIVFASLNMISIVSKD